MDLLPSITHLTRFNFDDVSLSLQGDSSNITFWAVINMFKVSGVFDYFGIDDEVRVYICTIHKRVECVSCFYAAVGFLSMITTSFNR